MSTKVHISDVKKFKSCRQLWYWSSPLQRNLMPRRTPLHFLIGRADHYALSAMYDTGEPPTHAYDRFVAYMRTLEGQWWDQKALDGIDLGRQMAENYRMWTQGVLKPDLGWKVVATELKFGPVPIRSAYSKYHAARFELEGRFDQVIEDTQTGELWLREFKTSARAPDEDWLMFDDQLTGYCWAIQNVMGRPIEGIQYRFMVKKAPQEPTVLKNGVALSRAINSSLSTTYEMYVWALEKLASKLVTDATPRPDGLTTEEYDAIVGPMYDTRLKQLKVEYADVLRELKERGWGEYFQEIPVRKTQESLVIAAQNLYLVAREMGDPNTSIYPSPDWLRCKWCPFRQPCIVLQEGGDPEPLLAMDFVPQVVENTEAIDAFGIPAIEEIYVADEIQYTED